MKLHELKFSRVIETITKPDGKSTRKVGKFPWSVNRTLKEISKRGLYGQIMYTLKKEHFAEFSHEDGSSRMVRIEEIDRETYELQDMQ